MFSANELVCERGERLLFSNLGFDLSGGEALLVGGGNGRGKTILLRILCGLSAPAAGTVRWRGEAIGRTRRRYRALARRSHRQDA